MASLALLAAGCAHVPAHSLPQGGPLALRAQTNGWTPLPDAPLAREGAAGTAFGLSLWVLGGRDAAGQLLTKGHRLEGFERWEAVPPPGGSRFQASAVTLNPPRLLLTGGQAEGRALGTTEWWDVATASWQRLPDLPTPRWGAGAAGHGVFAYVVGGSNGRPLDTVERFDARDRSWRSLAPLALGREAGVAATLGQRIVVVGGRTRDGLTGSLEIYDPATGVWKAGPAMPTPRSHAAFAVYGYHLFVLGGLTAQGPTAAVESFDLTSGTWTVRASLPEARHGAVAARVGERLVVTGGVVAGRVSAGGWRMPFPFGR
ncbi:MAG: kelch repeat-containing protein [Candidatus Sericytochromatia bacterium]|nr:kelch repeat-containing protein [Candidatus Sericytochromatia bacterium]